MKERKSEKADYTEENIELGMEIYNKIKDKVDFMLHIQKMRPFKFSLILIETNKENFDEYLNKMKRETDIKVNINEDKGLYMIICQETDVYGGHQFLERLFKNLKNNEDICSCASILAIDKTPASHMTTQDIIFRLLDNFIGLTAQPKEWKKCQISFKTLVS